MTGNGTFAPVWRAGLLCRCPRCGDGRLFSGFLKVAAKCNRCGQDFSHADSGDGPAVFIILIAGAIIAFGALYVEFTYRPPYWLHAALWTPLTLILTLGLLRPFKATMIALQFRNKAEEARRAD
jgi:uncharacterized protein (DUF983 family)